MIMLFSFTCIRLGLRRSGALLARGWGGVQRYRAVWLLWGVWSPSGVWKATCPGSGCDGVGWVRCWSSGAVSGWGCLRGGLRGWRRGHGLWWFRRGRPLGRGLRGGRRRGRVPGRPRHRRVRSPGPTGPRALLGHGVFDEGGSGSLVPAGGECCSGGLELRVRHGRLALGLLGIRSVLFEVLLCLAVVAEEGRGDNPVRTIRTPPSAVGGSDMVTDLDPELRPARARADRTKVQTDMTTSGTTPAWAGRILRDLGCCQVIMLFSFTCIRGWCSVGPRRGLGVQRYRAVRSSWGCLGRFRCAEGDLPWYGVWWSRPGPLSVQRGGARPGKPARWSSRTAWRMRVAVVP